MSYLQFLEFWFVTSLAAFIVLVFCIIFLKETNSTLKEVSGFWYQSSSKFQKKVLDDATNLKEK